MSVLPNPLRDEVEQIVYGALPPEHKAQALTSLITREKHHSFNAGYQKARVETKLAALRCAADCPNPGRYLHRDGRKYCFAHYAALNQYVGGRS